MAVDRRSSTLEIKVDTAYSAVAGMRESAEALLGGTEPRAWELPGLTERPAGNGYVVGGGGGSRKPFLLFTAAGDQAELLKEPNTWLHPDRNFDLAVLYYGDSQDAAEKLRSMADYFLLPKADAEPASKFQHLKRLWDRGPVDFKEYQAIGVWDDDAIVLRDSKIDTLFAQFVSKPNLFAIGPSYSRWLEPSFNIREGDPERILNSCRTSYENLKTTGSSSGLRYVDFLELNFPIIRADKLSKLLDTYTAELPGFGIDILMTCVLLRGGTADVVRDGFAVADGVPVCNPLRQTAREITKVSDPSGGHGKALWAEFKEKHIPDCHYLPWQKGVEMFSEANLD